MTDLIIIQLMTSFNAMPLGQTTTTAAGGRMLSDKHRVTAKRRLFTIIWDHCRRKTLEDKILSVQHYQSYTLVLEIGKIVTSQLKTPPE